MRREADFPGEPKTVGDLMHTTPAQAIEKARARAHRAFAEHCFNGEMTEREVRGLDAALAALRPDGEAVVPVGYMRLQDRNDKSFWCSRYKNAYYSEPVYLASPPAPAGVKVRELLEEIVAMREEGDCKTIVEAEMKALAQKALSLLPSSPEAQAGAPAEALPSQTSGAEGEAKPYAWVRRFAYDGIDVMKMKKADRPRGWNLMDVTRSKFVDDDVPLYLAKPASEPAGGGVTTEAIARWKRDSELLSAIQDECWDVRFTSSPNADAGDYNVNIEIIGHFMAEPQERVVGENYNEDLRAALEQAMTAEPYPPVRPVYDEPAALSSPASSSPAALADAPSNGSAPAGEER